MGYLWWTIVGFTAMNVVVVVALPLVVSGGYTLTDPLLLASLLSLPAYAVLLVLVRRGATQRAASGFVFVTFMVAWVFTVALQGTEYMGGDYGYLATVVMFAAFFVGARQTAAYAAACILGVVVVFMVWPFSPRDFTLSLTFLGVFSTMLVLTSSLLERDAQGLRDAADALAATGKELQEANQNLTTVFEHTDQALILVGRDGAVQVANSRSAELLNLAGGRAPAPGDNLLEVVPPEVVAQMQEAVGAVQAGRPGAFQTELRGRYFDARIVPTRTEAMLVLGRDITPEVERERDLIAKQDAEARLARMELVHSMHRNFMNIATHELQTPLTPVRLQLHVLRDRQTGPLNHAQMRSIEIIERNAVRLSDLVDEILDVVRIETARLLVDMGDVEMVELTRQEIERIMPVATAKSVNISLDGPKAAWVSADARRLQRVIRSLIDNAVKFVHAGGTVNIEIGEDDMMRWRIVDDGIGFDPALHSRLFKPFTQIHESAEVYGGSGLGLAISRGYIEAQGGHIEAFSEGPGRGAVFSFWLPLATKTIEH